MSTVPSVRDFVVAAVSDQLRAVGIDPQNVPDDLDLIERGLLDSLGLIQLITDIDDRYDVELDLEDLDPDSIGVVGPFCRHIEERVRAARAAR